MTILGGFNHAPLPTIQDVLTVGRTVEESAAVNTPIRESVQEFPPAINTGAFFAQTVRGPILPPYGTKDRDRQLRLMYRNEYNTLIQGTVSAIVKKFVTTPWVVKGDSKTLVYYADSQGRQRTMPAVEHYQLVFQNAQFGAGWEVFASRLLEDFFTQDFGGVMELIGPGEPIGPIVGPISGVAQLDAGRSYITGNPYYPIMYFSLISGSLHRMHVSRIARFVDSPSPDERYFGIGLCAMSRAVAVASRQAYMQRYIETRVDDKPAPGIMTFQGLTEKQRETAFAAYTRQQQNDDLSPFGKTLFLTSVNIDNPIKVETTPFAVTPEKFDWVAYNSLDVDAVALAFGIDRQELWELAGRGLGSGAQSQILAEKARGKMLGFLYQNCERLFNRRILPDEFEFEFERRDPSEQQVETAINLQLAQIVQTLAAVPGIIRPGEARSFLSDNSPAFKDVLATAAGTVDAGDATQEVELEDDNPIDVSQQAGGQAPPSTPTAPQATPTKEPPPPANKEMVKAFSITSSDFARRFASATIMGAGGQIDQGALEDVLLDLLTTAGTQAFVDGLRSGGVLDAPDEDDQQVIQDWLLEQIAFIDSFAREVASGAVPVETARDRADLWVNKSIRQMYNGGQLSANANGMYAWQLGQTEQHCPDCTRLNGQVHRLKDWAKRGLQPPTDLTSCKGFRCDCRLIPTGDAAKGRF